MNDYAIFEDVLFCEPAASNRTRCNRCIEMITKGEMRLVKHIPNGKYSLRTYWCKTCAIIKLKDEHDFIEKRITELR